METFGFIGAGNMGGALARAAVKTLGGSVVISDKAEDKAAALAAELGCQTASVAKVAESCEYIFLGVKPQVMSSLFAEIAPILAKRTDRFVLVSMAAGLNIGRIWQMAQDDYPIIRIMPNTPASVGEGMILYTSQNVSAGEAETFLTGMAKAGKFCALPENLIDAGSAVSGCGPAYVCLFIEALADGGVACGLTRQQAMELAAQTLIGTAKLVLESGQHPGALKDAVCSPGGSTIAGVAALENGCLRGTVMEAVAKAFRRTKELGNH